jgi:hypothetical protein
MRLGKFWRQRNGAVETFSGMLVTSEIVQYGAAVAPVWHRVRIEQKRAVKTLDCLIETPERDQRVGAAAMDGGGNRPEINGAVERDQRLGRPAGLTECHAKEPEDAALPRVERKSFMKEIDAFGEPALLAIGTRQVILRLAVDCIDA